MNTRVFTAILLSIVGIGLAVTVAHLIYTVTAYQQCSIIYFIAEELW